MKFRSFLPLLFLIFGMVVAVVFRARATAILRDPAAHLPQMPHFDQESWYDKVNFAPQSDEIGVWATVDEYLPAKHIYEAHTQAFSMPNHTGRFVLPEAKDIILGSDTIFKTSAGDPCKPAYAVPGTMIYAVGHNYGTGTPLTPRLVVCGKDSNDATDDSSDSDPPSPSLAKPSEKATAEPSIADVVSSTSGGGPAGQTADSSTAGMTEVSDSSAAGPELSASRYGFTGPLAEFTDYPLVHNEPPREIDTTPIYDSGAKAYFVIRRFPRDAYTLAVTYDPDGLTAHEAMDRTADMHPVYAFGGGYFQPHTHKLIDGLVVDGKELHPYRADWGRPFIAATPDGVRIIRDPQHAPDLKDFPYALAVDANPTRRDEVAGRQAVGLTDTDIYFVRSVSAEGDIRDELARLRISDYVFLDGGGSTTPFAHDPTRLVVIPREVPSDRSSNVSSKSSGAKISDAALSNPSDSSETTDGSDDSDTPAPDGEMWPTSDSLVVLKGVKHDLVNPSGGGLVPLGPPELVKSH